MKNVDLAWAAGFLDGEGCFRIVRHTIKGRKHPSFYGFVDAAQVDPRPLLKLQAMFGGSIVGSGMHHEGWASAYRWKVSTAQCQATVKAIRPYLVVKAEQADLILALGRLITPGRRGVLKDKERQQRQYLIDAISLLNKKGVQKSNVVAAKRTPDSPKLRFVKRDEEAV